MLNYFKRWVICIGILGAMMSCNYSTEDQLQADLIGCWELDSLYFRVDATSATQVQLDRLQDQSLDDSYFEFRADSSCSLFIDGKLMKGRWLLQDIYVKVQLDNATTNLFRLVDLKEKQLILEFPVKTPEGTILPLVQSMQRSNLSIEELLANKRTTSTCPPYAKHLQLDLETPLKEAYFSKAKALACAKLQNKPLLLAYVDAEGAECKRVEQEILALFRVQKFIARNLVVAYLYTDLGRNVPELGELLLQHQEDLRAWAAVPPFFALLDPQTGELIDSISNPKDDLAFKRFLVEGLEAFEQ